VIEMRMREHYMIDRAEFVERQVSDTGTGVDQDVSPEQEGSGTRTGTDPAAGSQNTKSHNDSR
jgi:hypothetical protein